MFFSNIAYFAAFAYEFEEFYASLVYAVNVALLVAIIAVVFAIGILFALFHIRATARKNVQLWMLLLQIPLVIPYSLSAVLLFLLYYPGGILGNFAPVMLGTTTGIVVAYLYKVCPFLLLATYPQLVKVKEEELAFFSLHTSSHVAFFRFVLLPRVAKPLCFSSFIVFAYTFAAFEIPFILGSGREKMPALIVMETLDKLTIGSAEVAYIMGAMMFAVIISGGIIFWAGSFLLPQEGKT